MAAESATCFTAHWDFKNATLALRYVSSRRQNIYLDIDTGIDKSDYLACVRNRSQNILADGCFDFERVTQKGVL